MNTNDATPVTTTAKAPTTKVAITKPTAPKAKTPKSAAKKVVTPAAEAKEAKTPAVRTSHSECTYAKSGREGKAARAACRRERAAAEANGIDLAKVAS